MKFKTNSPTIEISPFKIANEIADNILISLKDEIYKMVEDEVYDKLEYEYDVDVDNTNTNDLNNFIYDVYDIIYSNIEDNF